MLYYKCPTCRTLLANKQIPYQEKINHICTNQKMTEKEKDEAKRKVLVELELHRPCCRMRIMGFIDLIDKIK
jgi:DNA-directed RNA polymerase subunit N (RpoN/RPB10)